MKKYNILKNIVTLGPLGYLPAPGTIGSLVGMLLVLFLKKMGFSFIEYAILTILLTILVLNLIERARFFFEECDPSPIILDEVIGCLYIFIAIPFNVHTAIIGFLIFRFFDISKMGGIKYCERASGSTGIILDDLLSGVYANICLQILLFFKLIIF